MEKFLDYFAPERYDLSLELSHTHEVLHGKVQVSGTVHSEIIKFHAVDMQIESVQYSPADTPYYEPNLDCDYDYDGKVLSIPLTPQMAPKFFSTTNAESYTSPENYDLGLTLLIKFRTKLNHNMQGCYLSSYDLNGRPQKLVATQFESHYAREAFPCIDEPAAKATFSLTLKILDLQPSDVVLSNMPLINHYDQTFTFSTTPRMSTYLLAWVVGPLQSVSTTNQNGVRVSSYCALNQPLSALLFANETAARALEYYDQKFAESYPLPKLDQVALPDFEAGAMENWGLVTYRESCLLADSSATLSTKKSVATTVTHELSHQWFGNLVTMQWWDDLWLNESFATIMEYFATDHLYPDYHIWQDFFTSDCLAALRRDALRGVQSVQQAVHDPAEISTLFDSAIVYAKGARLVLMLIRLFGEDQFDQGIRYYFDQYKYHNTVGDDLWQALQLYADFDVKDFMHAWISQPGYPALQHSKNSNTEFWSQQRFFIDGTTDDSKWPIPETKDDMSGHYLIDLSDAEFSQKLASFAELTDEQKLRLLIDRMLLARASIVDPTSLLDLLPHSKDESSAAVLGIVSSVIGDLKLFCPPDSPAERAFKQYLGQIYQARFNELKLDLPDADSNTIEVRDLLLGLAYYLEEPSLMSQLSARYQDDFAALDSELRIYIIAAKMLTAEADVFEQLLAAYPRTSDPELRSDLLYCLALARQPKHLDQLLDLLDDPDFVRPQDHIFLYIYLLRNHRTRARVLNWATKHWDYVRQLTGDKSLEDYVKSLGAVLRTPAEAQEFHAFFSQFSEDPILKRALDVAETEIAARLDLIKSQSPRIAAKLQEILKAKK